MRIRLLLVPAFAAGVVAAAHAWPAIPPRPDAPRNGAPTLDQLIDRLADVRAKEAALQAERAELERQVRDRLAEQARRLREVGVSPAAVAAPILPLPLPGLDLDRPAPHAPPPAVQRTIYVPGIGAEVGPFSHWTQERVWTEPGALADRFDALGGLPLAYRRWCRENAIRAWRNSEPIYHGGGLFF